MQIRGRYLSTFLVAVGVVTCAMIASDAAAAMPPTPPPCVLHLPSGQILTTGQTLTGYDSGCDYVGGPDWGIPTLNIGPTYIDLSEEAEPNFGAVYWSPVAPLPPVMGGTSTLSLQSDGNLVFRDTNRKAMWQSATRGQGAQTLNLQSDGNLVLRDGGGRAVWATYTPLLYLRPGQVLEPGGRFGTNAVMKYFPTVVRVPSSVLYLRPDGNLQIVSEGKLGWSSNTHVAGSRLTMQTDGNLVLRAPDGHAVWASGTRGFGPHAGYGVVAETRGPHLVIVDTDLRGEVVF